MRYEESTARGKEVSRFDCLFVCPFPAKIGSILALPGLCRLYLCKPYPFFFELLEMVFPTVPFTFSCTSALAVSCHCHRVK